MKSILGLAIFCFITFFVIGWLRGGVAFQNEAVLRKAALTYIKIRAYPAQTPPIQDESTETPAKKKSYMTDLLPSDTGRSRPTLDMSRVVMLTYSCGGRSLYEWNVDQKTLTSYVSSIAALRDEAGKLRRVFPYPITKVEAEEILTSVGGAASIREILSKGDNEEKITKSLAVLISSFGGYWAGYKFSTWRTPSCDSREMIKLISSPESWKNWTERDIYKLAIEESDKQIDRFGDEGSDKDLEVASKHALDPNYTIKSQDFLWLALDCDFTITSGQFEHRSRWSRPVRYVGIALAALAGIVVMYIVTLIAIATVSVIRNASKGS